MGATRKPRKRYVPKRVETDPVEAAIAQAGLLSPGQRQELGGPVQRAFERARQGTGGWPAWCELADGLNVAEQLALRGICSDRMPEIMAGQRALQSLHHRHEERNTWTLRAEEITALQTGVDFHLIQLAHCTQGELRDAIFAVQRRVSQALAGNASPSALVCVGAIGKKRGAAAGSKETAA